MRHTRRVAGASLLVGGVVMITGAFGAGGAVASPSSGVPSSTNLTGFSINSLASGTSLLMNEPTAPAPNPVVEVDGDYATATLAAGPADHALASQLWPGSVVAGAGPALSLLVPGLPAPVPSYPVRAEAYYPQDPHDQQSQTVPGASMIAHANGLDASSGATLTGEATPSAISSANYATQTESSVVSDVATSTASSNVSHLDILGGLITAASVVSTATATSDGTTAKVAGNTVVSGLLVDGQPAVVTPQGVQAAGMGAQNPVPTQVIQQALAQGGVNMFLARPIDVVQGNSASRDLGGLIVQLQASALNNFVSQLPAPTASAIERAQGGNFGSSVFLSFASLSVNAAANQPAKAAPTTLSVLSGGGTGGQGTTASSATPSGLGGGAVTSLLPGVASTPQSPSGGVGPPSAGFYDVAATSPRGFGGLAVGLLVFLFGMALVAASGLARMYNDLFVATREPVCPLQGRR